MVKKLEKGSTATRSTPQQHTMTRGWPNFQEEGWFGVKGYERLNTFQLINHSCVVTKFGMSLTKFLIEQGALFEKFEISSTI
jgi:hypothetical protein